MSYLTQPPEPTAEEEHRWVRDTWRRFAIRTVKDGRVTIHGRTYAPSEQHMAYDGRLDGMRFAFGRYQRHDDFVSLWGTEAKYWAVNDDERYTALCDNEPECVDGGYPWLWWHEVPASSSKEEK